MPVVTNQLAVIASSLLLSISGNATPALQFAGEFGCVATLASPHPSGKEIKGHMRIQCTEVVPRAYVHVQLWRLRWWGWESVGTAGNFESNRAGRTFDTAAHFTPGGGCYYYRSTGSGYVIDLKGERHPTPGTGVNFDQRFLKQLPPGCGSKW